MKAGLTEWCPLGGLENEACSVLVGYEFPIITLHMIIICIFELDTERTLTAWPAAREQQ